MRLEACQLALLSSLQRRPLSGRGEAVTVELVSDTREKLQIKLRALFANGMLGLFRAGVEMRELPLADFQSLWSMRKMRNA